MTVLVFGRHCAGAIDVRLPLPPTILLPRLVSPDIDLHDARETVRIQDHFRTFRRRTYAGPFVQLRDWALRGWAREGTPAVRTSWGRAWNTHHVKIVHSPDDDAWVLLDIYVEDAPPPDWTRPQVHVSALCAVGT